LRSKQSLKILRSGRTPSPIAYVFEKHFPTHLKQCFKCFFSGRNILFARLFLVFLKGQDVRSLFFF